MLESIIRFWSLRYMQQSNFFKSKTRKWSFMIHSELYGSLSITILKKSNFQKGRLKFIKNNNLRSKDTILFNLYEFKIIKLIFLVKVIIVFTKNYLIVRNLYNFIYVYKLNTFNNSTTTIAKYVNCESGLYFMI